jgi:beta-glucosidase
MISKPALAMLLLATGLGSATAQTFTNRADSASRTVYVAADGSNVVGWAGAAYAPRVGENNGRGSVLVLAFQLPALDPGAHFATADFRLWLYNIIGQENVPFAIDLYALAARATSAVLPEDYYAHRTADTNATLLQAAYLVPGMTNGTGSAARAPAIATDPAANDLLVAFLNEQYNAVGAGSWVFLRLSPATNLFSGNYAYAPLTPAASESWAWPAICYTTTLNTNAPPEQTNNQTLHVTFPVQGMAYAKLNVSPLPVSVDPVPPEGVGTPSVVNPNAPVTYHYTFPPSTTVTVAKNQFTGSEPNTDIRISTVDYHGTTLRGASVSTLALDGSTWSVEVYSVTATNTTNSISGLIPDPYPFVPPVAVTGAFPLVAPADQAMITTTRRPAFAWPVVPGATRYDLYLNVSLTNYDWMAPGDLLDRFTHVGSVTSATSYTPPQDLPDRWTYKWYVAATDGATFTNRSDLRVFSVYLPVLTAVQDGITNVAGARDLNRNGVVDPYEDWQLPPSARVEDLVSRMTLSEKALQLFFNAQVYPEAGWAFGPFQAGDLLAYQRAAASNRLGIPMIATGDTIHGYKTSHPTQPGLAATRNLQLAWAVSDMQRRESVAVGYRGTLSPLAEVGTKVLYPRIQEGCGEDADFAAGMVRALVVGLQGGPEINPKSVMITTKHWCGQGAGGEAGVVYDGTTIHYHMRPWHAAIEAGSSAIMPGYAGSWLLGPGGGGAGDNVGILGYLRTNMGYQGLIMTDWLPSGAWSRAANAGSDVMGGADPEDMGTFTSDVPSNVIDRALRKVLDLKFRMGLFEDPYGSNVAGTAQWHTPQNVAIARQAAVESLTLLKNDGALPIRLPPGSSIVVTGPRARDPSCMVTWRSDFHNTEFGALTIHQALVARAAQAGITVYSNAAAAGTNVVAAAVVVVGESYFTHGTDWDKNSPWLPDDPVGAPHDLDDAPQFGLLQSFQSNGIPTITVCLLPRPYVLSNVVDISSAFLAVYRPGDEGGPAIAGTLFGDYLPSGRLPWQLPRSIAQVGVDDSAHWSQQPDKWDLPFDLGATTAELAQIRALIAAGQPVPPTFGDPLFQYGAGIQGFGLVDATPPQAFSLLTPADGLVVTGALPSFTWQAATDAETGVERYEVFLDGAVAVTTRLTTFTLAGTSLGNGAHSWRVRAYNWAGGFTDTPLSGFSVADYDAPAAFRAWLPANASTSPAPSEVVFCWEQTVDDGTGLAGYTLLLDGTNAASVSPGPAVSPTANRALNRDAYGSSTSFATPAAAVDGNPATRWSSAWLGVTNADTEWFAVDLGAIHAIRSVVLKWEAAYGKEYLLQASLDNATWSTLYATTNGTSGTNVITGLEGVGRFVRLQGLKRGSGYGYSLWEFEVYGAGTEQVALPLAGGDHTWAVRAIDGAGNSRTNVNAPMSLLGMTAFMQWQILHFGSTTNPAAAPEAGDGGSGQNNLFKYVAGLDPTNPASVFELNLAVDSNAPSLRFGPVWSDRLYRVEARTSLVEGIWTTVAPDTAPAGSTGQWIIPDTNAPAGSTYYRIGITRP